MGQGDDALITKILDLGRVLTETSASWQGAQKEHEQSELPSPSSGPNRLESSAVVDQKAPGSSACPATRDTGIPRLPSHHARLNLPLLERPQS